MDGNMLGTERNLQSSNRFVELLIISYLLLKTFDFIAAETPERISKSDVATIPDQGQGQQHPLGDIPDEGELANIFLSNFQGINTNITIASTVNAITPYRNARTKRSPSRRARWLKKYHEQFKKYEKCMADNEEMSKKFDKGFIQARIAMDRQSVTLSCHICLRPDHSIQKYSIKWRRRVLSSEREKGVTIDGEHFVLMPDKSLLIQKITLEDGGMYFCYRGDAHAASYMVDVMRGEKYQVVYNPPDKGRRPAQTRNVRQYNMKLTTKWTEWSKCNRCNKRGQYRRIGFCTVRKIDEGEPLEPEDTPWLNQFKEGLPCRSSLLPPSIVRLRQVRQRTSEILMSYCFIPCPTLPALKTYTDADGNVVEVVKANKGFVSMREGVPKLPKMVKRKIIYEKLGKRIMLDCPQDRYHSFFSKRKGDVSVRWQNGSQTMNALTIRRQTRGRVVIDPLHNLRILKLKMQDTSAYSCWIDGEHIATIKIRVITKMRRSYKDYILLSGFAGVILILCCVGCAVCRAQRKKTLK